MYAAAEQTYDALRGFGRKMDPGEVRERMIYAMATHLRARDAEVREAAKTSDPILRAWVEPGPNPPYHELSKNRIRKIMPVLAKALDEAERRGR